MTEPGASEVTVIPMKGDENVVYENTTQVHTSHSIHLSLAKIGPAVTTVVGGALVVVTLLSAVAAVLLLVLVNTPLPPEAVDDYYEVNKNYHYDLNVLSNDHDPRVTNLAISAVSQPKYGRVEIQEGSVELRYYAPSQYAGRDDFTYTITNGALTVCFYI